jgi:hypothetical protein
MGDRWLKKSNLSTSKTPDSPFPQFGRYALTLGLKIDLVQTSEFSFIKPTVLFFHNQKGGIQ